MEYVEKASSAFLDTNTRFPRSIIWAMGIIKYAAAKVNKKLGVLDEEKADVIMNISMELAEGKYDELIQVDVFQTGSGTGLNMNVNEVISKIALESYKINIHPNDHVNLGQSSNDVVPTAIRMAVLRETDNRLMPAIDKLIKSLEKLASTAKDVVKPGRTHLRDALPITMDMEFKAFIDSFKHINSLIKPVINYISEVPLGGTAVGTGFNTHPKFPQIAIEEINRVTGLHLSNPSERSRGMRLTSDLTSLSGILRIISLDILRLSQDIRLMYSGPFTGIGEIEISQDLPGSSMMPGKKNPVTVEAVMQAACQVIGLDQANLMASTLGELELNMGFPLIGYNLVLQIKLLSEMLNKFSVNVLDKIVINKKRCRELALKSPALITIVAPIIGYDNASRVAERMAEGLTIKDALKEIGFDEKEIKRLLDILIKAKPGYYSQHSDEPL